MSALHLLEYQSTWPSLYAQVESELRFAISTPGTAIEHIGSTAVPGLCAKPVLDVLLGLPSLKQVEAKATVLAALGYRYRPEYETQIPDRRYFVRAEGKTPRVHLHSVVMGSTLWQQHLMFRDTLRDDPEVKQSYAKLKKHLATLHATDKAAYTEAKAPFIKQVLAAKVARDNRA